MGGFLHFGELFAFPEHYAKTLLCEDLVRLRTFCLKSEVTASLTRLPVITSNAIVCLFWEVGSIKNSISPVFNDCLSVQWCGVGHINCLSVQWSMVGLKLFECAVVHGWPDYVPPAVTSFQRGLFCLMIYKCEKRRTFACFLPVPGIHIFSQALFIVFFKDSTTHIKEL